METLACDFNVIILPSKGTSFQAVSNRYTLQNSVTRKDTQI